MMPEMMCELGGDLRPPRCVNADKWARCSELEWMIENEPATPAQRDEWIDELAKLDDELAWLAT